MTKFWLTVAWFHCLLWTPLTAQTYDAPRKLLVYAVNFSSMPVLLQPCDLNANHVRAHPVASVVLKEPNLVSKFDSLFHDHRSWNSMPAKELFTCRVVLDFVKNDTTVFSVALNEWGEMTFNDDRSRIYPKQEAVVEAIRSTFPFLGTFF